MRILVACEFSGIVRDAFTARGHYAVSCDLLPSEKPGPHIQGDVLGVLYPDCHDCLSAQEAPTTMASERCWRHTYDLMIAHPPCTYLAVSGARWFKDRRKEQEDALAFVRALLDAPIPRIALENPVSVISTRIRKPDQIVQPFWFGHPETKATCLWTKNLPPLVPTNDVRAEMEALSPAERNRVHYASPGPNRWKERSRTLPGLAAAMADQWGAAAVAEVAA